MTGGQAASHNPCRLSERSAAGETYATARPVLGTLWLNFIDRVAERQDLHRAILKIIQRVAVIDTDVAVDAGPQIVRRERSFGGFFTLRVRRSHNLTRMHRAAGYEDRHRAGPMIAARLFDARLSAASHGDARRAAEFTRGNKQDFAVEATVVQIFDQR